MPPVRVQNPASITGKVSSADRHIRVGIKVKNTGPASKALRSIPRYKEFVEWAADIMQWLKWDHTRRLDDYKAQEGREHIQIVKSAGFIKEFLEAKMEANRFALVKSIFLILNMH